MGASVTGAHCRTRSARDRLTRGLRRSGNPAAGDDVPAAADAGTRDRSSAVRRPAGPRRGRGRPSRPRPEAGQPAGRRTSPDRRRFGPSGAAGPRPLARRRAGRPPSRRSCPARAGSARTWRSSVVADAASGRAGRRRAEAAGSSAAASSCGRGRPVEPASQLGRATDEAARPRPPRRAPRARARSPCHRAARTRQASRWAGVDPGIHPDERDPGLRVAGQDRGRDRRRATMSGQERRVDVEDPALRQVEDRRRHDPARSRPGRRDPAPRAGDRRRSASGPEAGPGGARAGRARAHGRDAVSASRSGSGRRGRSGAETTPTSSTSGAATQRLEDRDAEPATAEEDGPRASGGTHQRTSGRLRRARPGPPGCGRAPRRPRRHRRSRR